MEEDYGLHYGERIKLDNKDKQIIEQLQKNAKQSVCEIAKKTNLSRDIVKYRIRRLEKHKVIRFYHAFLNPSTLGYPLYAYVNFVLYNLDPKEEDSFIQFLRQHPRMIYVAKFSGKWDVCVGVCAKDYRDLDDTLRDVRKRFLRFIKDFEVSPVVQEYKYDYMADLV